MQNMKIAVSHCNGRIAPVFDVSENLFLIEVNGTEETGRKSVIIAGKEAFERAKELSRLEASVLICGAISGVQEMAVRSEGIEVRGFTCGELEAVIAAFIEGHLSDGDFMMPGCCGRRRGFRRGYCGRKNNKL